MFLLDVVECSFEFIVVTCFGFVLRISFGVVSNLYGCFIFYCDSEGG